jgi:hypothetical protein
MRRFVSIALVGAVALLAVAAALDAVRQDDGRPRSGGFPNRAELSGRLRALGIAGRLFYTDPGCRMRVLALPDLVSGRPPPGAGVGCSFSLSPGGSRVASFAGRWDRRGRLIARCRGSVVDFVEDEGSRPHGSFDGCAPAWRPGGSLRYVGEEAVQEVPGTLTLARDGEILQVTGCGVHDLPPCELVLLTRRDLLRAARRHPNAADAASELSVAVQDMVWLSRSRVVVLLAIAITFGPREQLVAIFEGRRLVATRALFDRELTELEATGPLGVGQPDEVFRADGTTVQLPRLTGVRATAIAPDGRWLAIASRASVHLVRVASGPGVRVVDLPLRARDVAWR